MILWCVGRKQFLFIWKQNVIVINANYIDSNTCVYFINKYERGQMFLVDGVVWPAELENDSSKR